MMQYNFQDIEKKWRAEWIKNESYKVSNDFSKPKCYVLDMFPYPSGAGLHVGHPLGYIASDIYARYKRLQGFNVLHPMGFDSFGLPAEQYAIETGQHPAVTTEKNIARYKEQLGNIGFCYDWSREVRTSDPSYYKWTQWIFLQLYNAWYNPETQKAEPISTLIATKGNLSEEELMSYRLAYRAESYVNWCEALGTVLANDEVVNGVSERGGHPVERKLMSQWFLRITAFAERLLTGLDKVDFPESLKEMQRNWIGKSVGAEINFKLESSEDITITVFTTRPDTIYGVSFMVLAPEHDLVNEITTAAQKQAISEYQRFTASRSERERLAETKSISGCFTGAYVKHPFTGDSIPVWISEYVLAGYGTGAIMAVPCGDERDYAFAKHFKLPIPNIFKDVDISEKAFSDKNVTITNSDFISDLAAKDAANSVIQKLEADGIGVRKINFRMRDAGFSRQRYWGEPFPIVYNDAGVAIALTDKDLPLELPFLQTYSAGPNGKGPLANATEWVNNGNAGSRETDTMPGYAGSSWYYLRYMDPHNTEVFCDKSVSDYWNQVDVYIGGAEHAVGHLLYSRMWCKTLHDLGYISFDEPYKKLINQGMIGGKSYFVDFFIKKEDEDLSYENKINKMIFCSTGSKLNLGGRKVFPQYNNIDEYFFKENAHTLTIGETRLKNIHEYIDGKNRLSEKNAQKYITDFPEFDLNISMFLWDEELNEDGENYIQTLEVQEKMSKSKYNVVNPDDIIMQYGADTFRMYEMFLGPLEMSKPWDTKGIEGVHRFLKKFWRLYVDEQSSNSLVVNERATAEELKILHKHIKKIKNDIEHFAFNTAVSQFMIITNELSQLKCFKKEILEPLLITLTPFAPHIAEELWSTLGHKSSILDATFPEVNEEYLVENSFNYPIAVQGKARTEMEFPLDWSTDQIQEKVLENEIVVKWTEGKPLKKFIFVKGKMINVVV